MKFLTPSYEIINADVSQESVYKRIESAARTCYKSFDFTTLDSYRRIIAQIITNKHDAMLEHASVPLLVDKWLYDWLVDGLKESKHYINFTRKNERHIISGNIRAFRDLQYIFTERSNNYDILMGFLRANYPILFYDIKTTIVYENFKGIQIFEGKMTAEEAMAHQYLSVRFINIPRGFSHEIVRMRCLSIIWDSDEVPITFDDVVKRLKEIEEKDGDVGAKNYLIDVIKTLIGMIKYNEYDIDGFSFAQMSTRFVDFFKEKYGREIADIEPPVYATDEQKKWLRYAYEKSEEAYMNLRRLNMSAEIARDALNIGLQTEIVCTGTLKNWRHVLSLRAADPTHPIMLKVMIPLYYEVSAQYPEIFGCLSDSVKRATSKMEKLNAPK